MQSKSVEPTCAEFLSYMSGRLCETHKYVSSSLWPFLTFFKLWGLKRVSCHGNRIFYSLRSVSCRIILRPIWRSTALTTKTKLRVFGSNVQAVLLYGSEMWRLTKRLVGSRSCKCSSIRAWGTSCGFGGLENWATRSFGDKQPGQRLIDREVRKRAWGWIGHTLRRPDGHVVKRALEWNPQWKRKRGRSQHTWHVLKWQSWRGNISRGMRQRALHKIGLGTKRIK